MVTTATYPVAPTATRLKGTLLDAATVRDGITWLDGKDLWSSTSGMKFGAAPVFCGVNNKDLDSNQIDPVMATRRVMSSDPGNVMNFASQ